MPGSSTPVDDAYDRFEALSRILERTRQQALADPMHRRNVDLGLTEPGRTKDQVERDIREAFEGLTSLINHVGILDMAAAFEGYFRARFGTAVGEARRIVREHYAIELLYRDREKLVHDPDDIEGLADMASVIGAHLSSEITAVWKQIREDRNRFAHGTNIQVPPRTTTEQAKETLNEIIRWV